MKAKLDVLSHVQQFRSIRGAARDFSIENQKKSSSLNSCISKIVAELAQKTFFVVMMVHRSFPIFNYDLERQVFD